MSLEFAYYPGCAAKQVQQEADWSAHLVADALGIKLLPMAKATCCGAVSLRESKPAFALAVAARILAEAEEMGKDICTVCSTCLQSLSYANHRFRTEPEILDQINAVLEEAGSRPYRGHVKVQHFLWVVTDMVDPALLKSKITKPLKGLRVAPFYGCHTLRPEEVFESKAGEKADHLDRLITVMGGAPVAFAGRDRCCGFHIMLSDKIEMRRMVATNCLSAKDSGADVMITPCTLCDMSMGAYQGIAERSLGVEINLPELNFTQLLGAAMGLEAGKLGMARLHVDPRPVLAGRGVL